MKPKSNQKKIVRKAWYVDLHLKRRKEFSGEAWKWRARIFPTRKIAKEAFGMPTPDIYPCEIHYALPIKAKKK